MPCSVDNRFTSSRQWCVHLQSGMRSIGLILCTGELMDVLRFICKLKSTNLGNPVAVVLASGYPQWANFDQWTQQQQQRDRTFYEDQLAALGILTPRYEESEYPATYGQADAYEQLPQAEPQFQIADEFGYPASNYREAPIVYVDQPRPGSLTRRRMGQKAPLEDIWNRREKKLNRNSDLGLDWPDFFNFNGFENVKRQSPQLKLEVPQVEIIYPAPPPEVTPAYVIPQEEEQTVQAENPFPQNEIPNWYSNNYGDEQPYVPDLGPYKADAQPAEPVEPPKSIQDQVEIVKKEKGSLTGDVASLLSLLGLSGPSKRAPKPAELEYVRNEPQPQLELEPEPEVDLRGHRLQPKRSMINTIKILMGIPPKYETIEEHMTRHLLLRSRMGEEPTTNIWGHTILNLLTNGRWSGNMWYPAGSEVWDL